MWTVTLLRAFLRQPRTATDSRRALFLGVTRLAAATGDDIGNSNSGETRMSRRKTAAEGEHDYHDGCGN